ncbi:MFS transporter [Ferrovum myxofaciens]|uniref:MFS transporter n=1 Tax=Ferrovum myxofaciens TaxID=416213 RepID=UPI00235287C3|nr:MFS transporter [Ferrovum myxofaciens]
MILSPFLDLTKKSLFGRDFPGRGPFFSANFLVGDIQTGIMPLLAVYLLLSEHWKAVAVGEVLAFGGLVTLIAQPIAGIMADQIVAKKTFFLVLVSLFAAGCFLICGSNPSFGRILFSQALIGVAQAGIVPVLSSVAMGLVGNGRFASVMGKAQGTTHAGSVFGAVAVLFLTSQFLSVNIFVFYGISALAAGLVLLGVPGDKIDPLRAREAEGVDRVCSIRQLFTPSLIFFLSLIFLFFIANTAMLPLAGEKLSGISSLSSGRVMGILVLTTQGVMIPFSLLAPSIIRRFGSRILLSAFCVLLSLRGGILFMATSMGGILLGQVLDGMVTGVLSVLLPVLVSEFGRGTGRFNLLQGISGTVVSAGGSVSQLLSGESVGLWGRDRTFLLLGGLSLGIWIFHLAGNRFGGFAKKEAE